MSQSALASDMVAEPPTAARPYGILGLVVSLVLILTATLLLTAVVGAGALIAFQAAKGDSLHVADLLDKLNDLLVQIKSDPELLARAGVAMSVVFYSDLCIVVLAATRLRGGRDWRDLVGWRPWHPLRGARLFWIVTIGTIVYGFGADALVSWLYPPSRDWISLPTGSLWIAIFLCLAIVIGPITEELLFRGWLYTGLRVKIGVWGAIIVTALLFAVAHWEQTHLYALIVFPVGVMLGLVREKTNSLLASIACHALFNGAASTALLFGQ